MKKLVGLIADLAILLIAGCPVEVAPDPGPEDPPGKKVEALLIGDWHYYPELKMNPIASEHTTALEISATHIKIYDTDGYRRSFVSETDCYTEDSVLYSADGTKLYAYYQKPLEKYQTEYDEVFDDKSNDALTVYWSEIPLEVAKKLGGQMFFTDSEGQPAYTFSNGSKPRVPAGLWKNNNPK